MNAEDICIKASIKWEKGNSKEAFSLFRKAADLGFATAQHNLGYFYDEGIGTKKDLGKALYWYKKAWRNDHQTGTCSNIAMLYASIGNNRRAIFWWERAVNEGDGDAALELAKFYLSRKRRKDRKKVIALLKKVDRTPYVTEDGREEALRILQDMGSEKGK